MLLIHPLLHTLGTTLLGTTSLGTVADVVRSGIMVLFFISAVMVILVVLAQEGKGGGLAGAFGGAGAETFGVKAGTVNKFTSWLAAAFLGLALLHAGLGSFTTDTSAAPDVSEFENSTTEPGDAEENTEEPAISPPGDKKAEDESAGDEKKPEGADPEDGDSKDGDSKDSDPKDDDPKKSEDK